MSKIFIYSLPLPFDDARKSLPSTRRAPLLLLHVCRTWKEIALSTHRLWDSLQLDLNALPKLLDTEIANIAAAWFTRAGSCPLVFSISLYVEDGHWAISTNAISAIISLLAPRLRSLCLELPRNHFEKLSDIGPFPALETLAVSHRREERGAPVKLFSFAPRLREVVYNDLAKPSRFLLPRGSKVSKMTCHLLSPDDFLALLQEGQHLKELSCYIYHYTSRAEVVTHDHLETLHIHSANSTGFLRLLRLPALRSLHLSSHLESSADYLAFLSSTSLQTFRADKAIISLSIKWFTAAMPSLVHIELCAPGNPFVRDFFEMLDSTSGSVSATFLPYLRTLVFRKCRFQLNASMLRALSSRSTVNKDSAILESFQQIWPEKSDSRTTESDPPIDNSTLDLCRELVRRGMNIYIGPIHHNLVWL
ncbi:hypothetical protein C8R46DRAFT_1113741 [Mycena filopes]|nr:hypothetical protein C8R46DRAFT_1113741 [Mycena filopes]